MEPWEQKVALSLSLHGSNDLRGGKRAFNSNVLVNNWLSDRLSPVHAQPLTSWRVYHPLYRSVPIAVKRETTYVQAYDYGDWRRRPLRLSKYGLLGHDESGPETWTTETRAQFENPALRRSKLERMGYWPYEGSIYPKRVRGGDDFALAQSMPVHVPDSQGEEVLECFPLQGSGSQSQGCSAVTENQAGSDEKAAFRLQAKLPSAEASPRRNTDVAYSSDT